MGAISTTSDVLDQALRQAGLEDAFDARGVAHEDCPGCGAAGGLKLSLSRGRVHCAACGSEGPLIAYLREKTEAGEWNHEPFSEAEIIPIDPRLPVASKPPAPIQAELVEIGPAWPQPTRIEAPQGVSLSPASEPRQDKQKWAERLIISMLALVFLMAGLAAAGLSGFANFQAFSAGVSEPMQARVWGWSGVIASVCSFGGFTFFWWHMSDKRVGESLRALVFAFA
ncbi:MAG: hypothetical protein AAFY82_08015, partial [Pseudomonadota bacterium]